jgi:hypothetical protein
LAGELSGLVLFDDMVGSAYLIGGQQPTPVVTGSSGVGTVAITGPLTVNVSLSLSPALVNQTGAHLHLGGNVDSVFESHDWALLIYRPRVQ